MRGPLLFIVFNRPALTARVFATIREARPPRLYVAADGPRPGHPTDAARSKATRAVATAIDWPCELHTRFLPANQGARVAIESAITWFFDHEPEGIVIEEDVLPDTTFFPFVEEQLARYRPDHRVGLIGGLSLLAPPPPPASYAFSNYAHMFGWGTWARVWRDHDPAMADWPDIRASALLRRVLNGRAHAVRHWTRTFDRTFRNPSPQWDNALQLSLWRRGLLSVIPGINMITNIGYGAGATTNAGPMPAYERRVPARAMPFPLVHPSEIAADPAFDARVERETLRIGWWSESKVAARALLGPALPAHRPCAGTINMMLVEVAEFMNPIEAEMARGALAAAGIEARLFDAGVSGTYGGALALAPTRLLVGKGDEAVARAILDGTA